MDDLEEKLKRARRQAGYYRMLLAEAERQVSVLLREIESGPENSREEVTGLGGSGGSNKNCGNSGFSGGCIGRLAAARP